MYNIEIGDLIFHKPHQEINEDDGYEQCFGIVLKIDNENSRTPIHIFWFDTNSIDGFNKHGAELLKKQGKYSHEYAEFILLKDPV